MSTTTDPALTVASRPARPVRPAVRRRRWPWLLGAGVFVVVAVAVLSPVLHPIERVRRLLGGQKNDDVVYTVKPVTLQITLKEDGELKPVDSVELKSQVQGQRVTIEWIVDESTRVQKGDVVVRLASDDLKDRVSSEAIELAAAEAGFKEATQALEITKSENASRLQKAKDDLDVARLELKRYQEGEREKSLLAMRISRIQTQMDLARKEDERDKTVDLVAKGFVTPARLKELEDEVEKLKLAVERARVDEETFQAYDDVKSTIQKEAAVKQATEEFEREKQRCQSKVEQAQAKLENQEASLKNRKQRFERLKEQLEGCEMKAPADGIVQYGESGESRFWRGNRIAVGEQVYPGQTLITIPDTSKMMVTTRIHEADRHRVQEGMRCTIKVPAVPDHTFTGTLQKIAKFADSEWSRWNPSLKEHSAEILLEETDAPLSPGETAHIEILIEEVPDVLAVPVQCVFSRGPLHFVFVQGTISAKPVEVKLGRLTTTMVEITSGLAAGDRVLMAPDERMQAMLPAPPPTATQAAPPEQPAQPAQGGPPPQRQRRGGRT